MAIDIYVLSEITMKSPTGAWCGPLTGCFRIIGILVQLYVMGICLELLNSNVNTTNNPNASPTPTTQGPVT